MRKGNLVKIDERISFKKMKAITNCGSTEMHLRTIVWDGVNVRLLV